MIKSIAKISTFAVLFLCLGGCPWDKPSVPHICDSATAEVKTYCYARVNLNDLITAANLSRADGSLSESSHDQFIAKAKEADQLLDAAELILSGGGTADQQLLTVKKILLELQ
jgi:hypothetical protein